jgi:hypothetical protein
MSIYSKALQAVCQTLKERYSPKADPSLIKNVYMPRLIRYAPISYSAKVAGAELLDRLNLETGQCNLSRSESAGFLTMDQSTFSFAIKELEENNIIFVERAPRTAGPITKKSPIGGGPPKVSNQYDFNWELLLDLSLRSAARIKSAQVGKTNLIGRKIQPIGRKNQPRQVGKPNLIGWKIQHKQEKKQAKLAPEEGSRLRRVLRFVILFL